MNSRRITHIIRIIAPCVFLLPFEISADLATNVTLAQHLSTKVENEELFCAEWNPAFAQYGHRCCPRLSLRDIRRPCPAHRRKRSYCDEVLPFQKQYIDKVQAGTIPDLLDYLKKDIDAERKQSHCHVHNGFLAYGRPTVPTKMNRIHLNWPSRCTNFGTDSMVAMLEWLGRSVAEQYKSNDNIKLVIGDVSAPKGGCLSGRGGRRMHVSHTSGLDVDVAFFNVKNETDKLEKFSRDFKPDTNWWFLKKVFQNPYACIKVVLLDQRLIRKLRAIAKNDPQWKIISPYLRHAPGHKDHFHIRVGEHVGVPGCPQEDIEIPS